MSKEKSKTKDEELYPQHRFTQKELRFLFVDCGDREVMTEDGILCHIRDDGPINPIRPDSSGFYLEPKVNDKS